MMGVEEKAISAYVMQSGSTESASQLVSSSVRRFQQSRPAACISRNLLSSIDTAQNIAGVLRRVYGQYRHPSTSCQPID